MADESRNEPLTRRRPGENRGHQPAGRAGSARLPEDVLRRTLSAIRSGTDAPAEAAEATATAAAAEAASPPAGQATAPPAAKATAPGRQGLAGEPALPSWRGRPLGFGPGADAFTQPIPVLPADTGEQASPATETRAASTAGPAAPPWPAAAAPPEPVGPKPPGPRPVSARRAAPERPAARRAPARSRARRYRVAGAAAAVVTVIAGVTVARVMLSPSPPGRPHDQPAVVRGLAAAWIAGQLSRSGIISCDPVMCAALRSRGLPAGHLLALTSGHGDALHSAVIVATAAVRADLGARLATKDAPGVIAVFGSAAARIEVRTVAARGPAAFQAALRADLTQRRESGAELLGSDRIMVGGAARRELAAGDVDARLLVTLATLGAQHRIDVVSFSDGGPGASLSVSPYRAAELTQATAASDPAFGSSVLSFLRSQHPPFAAALVQRIRRPGGRAAVRVMFAAPSPLDLLNGSAGAPSGG